MRTSHGKRRTTLTLSAAALDDAARIARTRKVDLSTVVSEAMEAGLRAHRSAARVVRRLSTSEYSRHGSMACERMV